MDDKKEEGFINILHAVNNPIKLNITCFYFFTVMLQDCSEIALNKA